MTPDFDLTGHSGRTYQFSSHSPDVAWNPVAGCYAFAVQRSNAFDVPTARILYIGQTDSFQRRMQEHQDDTWAVAARNGANTVLTFVVTNEVARLATEADLIRYYQPKLNTQHVQQNPLAQWPHPARNALSGL